MIIPQKLKGQCLKFPCTKITRLGCATSWKIMKNTDGSSCTQGHISIIFYNELFFFCDVKKEGTSPDGCAALGPYLTVYCTKTQRFNYIYWCGWSWIMFYGENIITFLEISRAAQYGINTWSSTFSTTFKFMITMLGVCTRQTCSLTSGGRPV